MIERRLNHSLSPATTIAVLHQQTQDVWNNVMQDDIREHTRQVVTPRRIYSIII